MELPRDGKKHPLLVFAEQGKRVVAGVLMVLMFVVLGIAVVELMWVPLTIVFPGLPGGTNSLLMSEAELLSTFGLFLSVLIALELVETVEVYFKDNEIHAEIVLLVALIALARKVVLLDLKAYAPLAILGMAALFVGLAIAYTAIRWAKVFAPERNGGE
jgi:uncharacterized membrane protein (DUF373 family)